jgi:uncharacterized protein (DUF58 family)
MRKGRIETRGSVLLGGAVALSAAGLLRVDGVLMALGGAAGVLLLLGFGLGWVNLRRLKVGIELPKVAQAGVPVRIRVTVENGRRMLDGFGLGLEIKTPGGLEVDCQVPWVPAQSGADVELRAVIPQRGHGEVIELRVSSRFPLSFFRFSMSEKVDHLLLVLPHALMPRELVAIGSALEAEPHRTAAVSEAMGEPRGLREYRAGDPAKVIAWPASVRSQARGGGLMVRELDPPGFHPQKAVIVFHSFATDGALIRPDRFERAVSLVWGAMRHFQVSGVPTVLMADFEEWVPRRVATRKQLGQAGEMLAKAKRSGGTEEHELLGRLQDMGQDEALIVISDMPAANWRDYLGRRQRLVVVDIVSYERKQRERRGRA